MAVKEAGRRPGQEQPLQVLDGRRLEYVLLDDAVVLGFGGGCRVVIEAVAQLDGPDGRVTVEPGDDASPDGLAVLLGDVVREARTGDGGQLLIAFAGGPLLRVDADADAESWAITGPGSYLMICLAAGEIARWGGATVT